jgi:DNA-binding NarL/FixJ family response regulator
MTKILLVDDHRLVRNGIRLIIDTHDKLSVVAEVDSAEDALVYLEQNTLPDLVLTDVNMLGMDGISFIRMAKKIYPEVKFAILSMIEELVQVVEAFRAGADGYLSKGGDYDEILFGLLRLAQGHKYLMTNFGLRFMENFDVESSTTVDVSSRLTKYEISEREFAVLELIAQGFTAVEIADKIFLSKRTVEGHRQNLMDKTKSKNTADLIRFAFQQKLLS